MGIAGVLATQLTDHSARVKLLYIDNTDVVFVPAGGGNQTGVPIDTVTVTEAGPGGVSSMEFTIDDPGNDVSIHEGSEVRFHDVLRDAPLFLGFVQVWSVRPAFGDQGRSISVTAVGVEKVLDWAILPAAMTFLSVEIKKSGGTYTPSQVIGMIVSAAVGLGPIRAFVSSGQSTQATPVADASVMPNVQNGFDFTIAAGTSVRAAIEALWDAMSIIGGLGALPDPLHVTVDFTYGLRVWMSDSQPTDYTDLTILDTPTSTLVAEGLDYTVDAANVVRGVLVDSTDEKAFVSDGSGLLGPIHIITEPEWIDFPAVLPTLGAAYLADHASGVRGSYRLTDWTPTATIHPGSQTIITDARLGLAAESFPIAQIDKTFNPTRDNWTVSFGNPPASVTTLIRHLTRDTLS